VAPDRLADASAVLRRQGYRPGRLGAPWTEFEHAVSWWRPADGARADLHWCLVGIGASPEQAWDRLWATSVEQDCDGIPARILSREGRALHLALHAAHHGPRSPKALGDLRRGLTRWPDVWRAVTRLAHDLDAVPAYVAGLRLVPEGRRLVDEEGLDPAVGHAWLRRYGVGLPGAYFIAGWEQARGPSAKLAVARRTLVPDRRQMETWYPEMREARMARAFYVHRVVRALPAGWRALRYRRRVESAR